MARVVVDDLDARIGDDVVVLGGEERRHLLGHQRLDRPDQQPVKRSLAEVGFPTAIDLLATYAGRRSDLAPWLADARINRDRRPWLQYQAGWEAYTEQTDDVYGAMAAYRRFPEDLFVGSEALKRALLAGGSGASRSSGL